MPTKPKQAATQGRPKLYREQLITNEDLSQFKQELLVDIRKLLAQSMAPPPEKWLKSPEVRKLLAISPGTLQNLRANGTLPFTKIGGVIYYSHNDIQKMLELNKTSNQK